jgi:hypothetical protein
MKQQIVVNLNVDDGTDASLSTCNEKSEGEDGRGLACSPSIGKFMMCSLIQENTICTLVGFLCNTFYIWQSSVFSFWYVSKSFIKTTMNELK